ncbi:Hsp70 protein that interacts with Zuo1p [Mycoemilia scoparia]|uniref:Hsp70 protein that interacts with Zuo1p n=1 Tax=Mycoemilia scoparia TaxID=417184 RepID=A0A9W8DSP3_9FUNG|nr:Hsp70 protein that interacts with Zuo1p [Mycoemilia scoparia]
MAQKTYIGLSFGNHNSVIAILNKEGNPEVIANEDGEHKTPTYMAYSGSEEYAGSQAKHQAVRNAKSTLVSFRNLLGITDIEPSTESFADLYCPVTKNANGELCYKFTVRGDNEDNDIEKEVTVKEAAVKYLTRLVQTASTYLGTTIDGAVLAVPTYFTDSQKEALSEVCKDAGVPLLQTISEPCAAAITYGLGQSATKEHPQDTTALVVDVGGSSSELSIVSVRGGLFSVAAHTHLKSVSGDKVDQKLVEHFAEEFSRKTGIDIIKNNDKKALAKLSQACEVTKRTLSSASTAPCPVESLSQGLDLNGVINRIRFNIRTSSVYRPLGTAITTLLAEAGYTVNEIDQVLFVGGAARIPKLQSEVSALFPETTEIRTTDAGELDELIAEGCAKQAALISSGKAAYVEKKEVVGEHGDGIQVPALSKSVGLRLSEDKFLPILLRDTPAPASRAVVVSVPKGESVAFFSICEGDAVEPKEEEDDEENDGEVEDADQDSGPAILQSYKPGKLLGEMVLRVPESNKPVSVSVNFFVGKDHKLTVTATEKSTNTESKLEIA